jgi:Prokaryotic homologs of the JAB domain
VPCELVDSAQERARAREREAERLSFYPPDAVLLRDQDESLPAAFRVNLLPTVRRQIVNEIQRVRQDADRDIEAGGFLFAAQRPHRWHRSIEICFASWAGPGASANRDSIRLGDLYRVLEELPAHFQPVGSWHSHSDPGTARPSRQDLLNWATNLDRRGLDAFAGIIVAPASEGGWTFPVVKAWVVRREGCPSRPIVERAALN